MEARNEINNNLEGEANICKYTDSDDDVPQLSAETLRALQEFYNEKESKKETDIDEDWQLSQFWYDSVTGETLAREALTLALKDQTKEYKIACVSCPTLYKYLRKYVRDLKCHPELTQLSEETCSKINIKIFEYDERFKIYGDDFEFYDYKQPLVLREQLKNSFDLIIADPPFLSEECQVKTGMTIRKLGKEDHKLIMCTGAVMEDLLASTLKVKLVSFVPRHEKNLANEFKCYASYETHFLNR